MRVDVKPEILRWARERAGLELDDLVRRFPKYIAWENGETRPTLNQLERFAKIVHAPVGALFLSKPLDEPFPIPDFRTVGSEGVAKPSPDLLETIYLCQRRQDWYRDYALSEEEDPLPFIGSVNLGSDIEETATGIRVTLGFDLKERRALQTWTEALLRFIEAVDSLGVLVMVNGVVGNNTHRKLNPDEFRGFALVDDLAPLVFINGADTKAAQMFTLAHELAHLWLGRSALSDSRLDSLPIHTVESWCNQLAAEFLVPLAAVRKEYSKRESLASEMQRLARHFKVSTLVVLRRIRDTGQLSADQFRRAYGIELARLQTAGRSSGGNFYATQTVRVGRRFAQAVVASTLEGRTLYRDAFRMLGFSRPSVFQEFAERLVFA